jgi:hypothetical protein
MSGLSNPVQHHAMGRSDSTSQGRKEFETVGKQLANTTGIYIMVDVNPIEGNNYYQLNIVDMDGSSKLSKVITISFEKGAGFIAVENPAINGEFKLMTNLKNPNFILLNSVGKSIDIRFINEQSNSYKVKVASPIASMYYLNIVSDGKVTTKKVLTQ